MARMLRVANASRVKNTFKKEVILIGRPGSGKGGLGRRLATSLCAEHLEMGPLLAGCVEISKGKLVGDNSLVIDRLRSAQAESDKSIFIIDGFPRNNEQAEQARSGRNNQIIAIHVDVPHDECFRRLCERTFCPKCNTTFGSDSKMCNLCHCALETRVDDQPEIAANRLRIYEEHTHHVLKHKNIAPHLNWFQGDVSEGVLASQVYGLIKDKWIRD